MANVRDRILIVENDPSICDLLGRQSLQAAGYQVTLAHNAGEALARAAEIDADVIIANINLPGLNGKDLLLALDAQGITTPVIMLAPKGHEAALIQTFRLGAADFLLWPAREAEIVAVVERLLKQAHERRERDRQARQFQQTNTELQRRVRELSTIYSIGKAVTTVIDQSALFEKILDGGATITQADLGWFLVREENSKVFLLTAHRNLPPAFATQTYQPLDDGISSLVAMSGEPLSIYGEPLKRFKVSTLGQSVLIAPVKVQKQVIGMLVVMRKQAQPFSVGDQHLLEAVADYASISLVNARLFRGVEERARSLQAEVETSKMAEKIDCDMLDVVKRELSAPLEQAQATLERVIKEPTWWSTEQRQQLFNLRENLTQLSQLSAAIHFPPLTQQPGSNLKELVHLSIDRLQPYAKERELSLVAEVPAEAAPLAGDRDAVSQVLDALISNAIKFSKPGGQITIHLEKTHAQEVHLAVTDNGPGIDPRQAAHIFEKSSRKSTGPHPFGGIGISLPLAHEIVLYLKGKMWVESKTGQGASFHLTLPLVGKTIENSGKDGLPKNGT